jgi:hypothetical protein
VLILRTAFLLHKCQVRTWNTAVSATNLDQVFVLAERQKKHAAAKRSKSIKAIEFAIGFSLHETFPWINDRV